MFINAWKNVGYQTVLYLAVISGISQDYYEAAVLDGASKFQQAWYITVPHLRLIMAISIIMSMGSIFRGDFGLFYVVTKNSGRIYDVTDVIDTYIYRGLTQLSNVGTIIQRNEIVRRRKLRRHFLALGPAYNPSPSF